MNAQTLKIALAMKNHVPTRICTHIPVFAAWL